MHKWTACDQDEDAVSMALTATRRLIERHSMQYHDVGMLQTASESLLDRSKSIKSNIMFLFPHTCCDVEGVDSVGSTDGGTVAVLACTNWLRGPAWDGRWAIVVCSDVCAMIAGLPLFSGAAAVVILLGPDAPLAIETGYASRKQAPFCHHTIAGADALFATRGDHPRQSLKEFASVISSRQVKGDMDEGGHTELIDLGVTPWLQLACHIGPCGSASVFVNLCSLLLNVQPAAGTRIDILSCVARAEPKRLQVCVRGDLRMNAHDLYQLGTREQLPPEAFLDVCRRFTYSHGFFNWCPVAFGTPTTRSYRLRFVDTQGRRDYEYVPLQAIEVKRSRLPSSQAVGITSRSAGAVHVAADPLPAAQLAALLPLLLSAVASPAGVSSGLLAGAGSYAAEALHSIARGLLGTDVSEDVSLFEAGLDSLGALEIHSQLCAELSDATLPESLVADFPTLRQIEAQLHARRQSHITADPLPAAQLAALLPLLLSAVASPAGASSGLLAGAGSYAAEALHSIARGLLGTDVSEDVSLFEAGLDSLGALEIHSQLCAELSDTTLPESLVADFPTLRQIEAHLGMRGGSPHEHMRTRSLLLSWPRRCTARSAALSRSVRQRGVYEWVVGWGWKRCGRGTCTRGRARSCWARVVSADVPLLEAGLDSLGALRVPQPVADG